MNEKPWLKHYDAGVPHSLKPYPQKTLLDIVNETTSQRPNHPALLFKGAVMTYSQLEQLSNDFAHALIKMGVKKMDRVALVIPNTPQLVLTMLGTWKAGGIAVPLNALYTEHELELSFPGMRGRNRGGHDALLQQDQGDPGAYKDPQCHRHEHQGIPAACPAHFIHPAQREKGRGPHSACNPGICGWQTCSTSMPAHPARR